MQEYDFSTIFITGSTASGKSSFALALAELCQGEIVNADAYQLYEGIPILTASPTSLDKERCPHHLYEFLPLSEEWNASLHYHQAMKTIRSIHEKGKRAIVVGGSGLYLKFLTHGLADAPPSNLELRTELEECDLAELVARFQQLDPEGALATNLTNKRYVVRNLEIVLLGGKPLSHWKQNWLHTPSHLGILVSRPPEELEAHIPKRTLAMLEQGAIDEVKALPDNLSVTAEKTLGIRTIREYLRQERSYDETLSEIALLTRQFAKRQRTWFRKENWLKPLSITDKDEPFFLAKKLISDLTISTEIK